MKKFAIAVFLIGLIVAAAAVGIGILVRDNEEVQAIGEVTGIRITPEHGEELRQAALDNNLKMSGVVSVLLRVYPYIAQVASIAAAVAAGGLLLLLLVLIIKPVMAIVLIALIAGVAYFGANGTLGPQVENVVKPIVDTIKLYFEKVVSFVNETKIVETFNNLVKH